MNTRDQLLLFLNKKRGSWVSGELLSNDLAVSRAAIWKHVRKLKEEGYVIASSTKKGYLLDKDSDLLLAQEIEEGLDTRVFGKRGIDYFKELDSTNMRAKELARGDAPEGTVIIAENQTRGRGRMGRNWSSPKGDGIYASLILRPVMSPGGAPRITLMTAVAVADALLSQIELELKIKWPNDILVKGKKLAGILTEISTEMDAVNYILVGLGLNVNIAPESFPEEIREKATSLFIETGERFPRVKLMRAYLEQFEKYYEMFKRNDFFPIMHRWKQLSGIVGQKIRVDVMGRTHVGKVVDIDDDGVLILKDNQGRLQRIFSGDVTLDEP